ncbi:hypothetical protein NHX12_033771 [Muraenolepis orangiensis]|uniref:F-box/LRR-repeat protein 5 n=1 Tax=Muraenolepis orangiensis TaxID=630683 RepID=A0A9Q0IGK7_9TELE|nr:hypothetical protein NHX12_033771 [Muraenolepis orangiensis]
MSPSVFPEEVDVFTGPHWRMKQLVGLYCDKLSNTNFSNHQDFRSFLRSLCDTFTEFKMHEQIENECIIGLLQQRSCTVYNVHSDNKLSDMLSLFHKGLVNVKNEHEQLNYARQLKERLEAFTQDFLPHMKEEEEVFQPMLMQYFSYEELKDIKKQVMEEHRRQQQSECAAEVLKGLSLWSQAEELQKAFKYKDHEKTDHEADPRGGDSAHISLLPTETLLRLLGYLGPADLCRCSQVCSRWAQLARTGSLWRHLYPVHWATGGEYRGPPDEVDQEPHEDWVKSRRHEDRVFRDEDADVDESDVSGPVEDSRAISVVQREKKLLKGMIQNLLPVVSSSVRSVVLAYSSTVSSKMVRQVLALCPNITHLDLTQTDITDSAFDCWSSLGSSPSLEHLDLSGCEKISDQTLKKLSVALGGLPPSTHLDRLLGRRARLLRSPALPPGPKRRRVPARVWLLDPSELTDIEDTAEWSRRGAEGRGRSFRALSLEEGSSSCCCRRSKRRGHRTALGASFLQRRYGTAGDTLCDHYSCCSGDTAPRTEPCSPCEPFSPGESCFHGEPCSPWEPCSPGEPCSPWEPCSPGEPCSPDSQRSWQGRGPGRSNRRPLRFLSLSGCYQVTDAGLRALSQGGGLPSLEHLNLSGCLLVTEVGLRELVSACPALNDEHFYYCDNIDGPHADTASGCQNLQCGFRACCRSGE